MNLVICGEGVTKVRECPSKGSPHLEKRSPSRRARKGQPSKHLQITIQNTSEVIKRLPEFPEIMDKANQALTYLASGQIPQNSNSYTALNTKKSEMTAFRNQSIIGFLVLVIFGLLVF